MKRIMLFLSAAKQLRKWTIQYIQNNPANISRTVFYTYWLGGVTMGVGMVKEQYPEIKLISRAHGGDLYEARHVPPYLPYRRYLFSMLDRLVLISDDGNNYLSQAFPEFTEKFRVCRLGVEDPGQISKPSPDGTFRIVSCSSIISVKRIDLLISGLKDVAQQLPAGTFEWIHIGNGPQRTEMEEMAHRSFPSNISYKFLGIIPHEDVISFYLHNHVDVFINVSSSEGIPVSIMEAQSCGIPVIATAVGGVPEIVNNEVGILLRDNPSSEDIADAIFKLRDDTNLSERLRKNSRSNWHERFNARRNFQTFTSILKEI